MLAFCPGVPHTGPQPPDRPRGGPLLPAAHRFDRAASAFAFAGSRVSRPAGRRHHHAGRLQHRVRVQYHVQRHHFRRSPGGNVLRHRQALVLADCALLLRHFPGAVLRDRSGRAHAARRLAVRRDDGREPGDDPAGEAGSGRHGPVDFPEPGAQHRHRPVHDAPAHAADFLRDDHTARFAGAHAAGAAVLDGRRSGRRGISGRMHDRGSALHVLGQPGLLRRAARERRRAGLLPPDVDILLAADGHPGHRERCFLRHQLLPRPSCQSRPGVGGFRRRQRAQAHWWPRRCATWCRRRRRSCTAATTCR